MEKKTIKEWLERLPQPFRKEALQNTKPAKLHCEELSLYYALKRAFPWSDSPEGYEYWENCSNKHT